MEHVAGDEGGIFLATHLQHGKFAEHLGDHLLQLTHAGFACITICEIYEGFRLEGYLVLSESIAFQLFREKMPGCDLNLLCSDVAGNGDYLHSVEKRSGDSLKRIGRSDKENIAQVVVDIQIIVVETGVLFRIKHLQQRGRRISLEILSDLINLIEHHHRI